MMKQHHQKIHFSLRAAGFVSSDGIATSKLWARFEAVRVGGHALKDGACVTLHALGPKTEDIVVVFVESGDDVWFSATTLGSIEALVIDAR